MSSFLYKSFIGSLICFTISSFSEETSLKGPRHYRMAVRHIESGGVGYDQGYTTFEVFLAPDPSQLSVMPFVDLRGHVFDGGEYAANAGVGIRVLSDCRVYGANVYYDYRDTKRQHYNQIGLGFETLGVRWDFRANAYLPVGSKTSSLYDKTSSSVSVFDAFKGNQALIKQTTTSNWKQQFAMTGVNTEAAFHILKKENIDLYAAVGPYYYNYSSNQAIGGQARLGVQIYEYLSLELINSYDSRFHENIQGSVGVNIPFGGRSRKSKGKKNEKCSASHLLAQRLVQDVQRQEIIVVDKLHKTKVAEVISSAINPLTGNPYFFVFVDNTSSSLGTYESPYPTLALAEENSHPGDIIYVFPGDGTTTGMDSGIFLQTNQKFWGSGVKHVIETSGQLIEISAQSNSFPVITNNNVDTEGNAVTLANNNAISGFIITSPNNDAIFGADSQNLEVSYCIIEDSVTYAIEATFNGDSIISLTNNQFVDNANGAFLSLNGGASVICSNNTFEGQTSVSSVPLEIAADSNAFSIQIENNFINNNETGGVRFNLDNVVDAKINLLNNTITNNGTGSQASLGSSLVVISNGTVDNCSLVLTDNLFSDNALNSLYMHTSGQFTNLEITASSNVMNGNGGSALVLATQVDDLTLMATDNIITGCNDNGIAVISSGLSSLGNIIINKNIIEDIGGSSNGIAINQDFLLLNLNIENNQISRCEGTGIVSYAPTGIDSFILNISNNTISNCENQSSNAASGIDIEQYISLEGSLANNTLLDNTGLSLYVGSTLSSPTVCLTLTGNDSNTDYLFVNPIDGLFNLSPCEVDILNIGTISTSGTVTPVQLCPDATPCSP